MEGQGREGMEWKKGGRRDYPSITNSVTSLWAQVEPGHQTLYAL